MDQQLAYLVIREGSKWTDVFRLVPGQNVTIGRSPTNHIVVRDDRCSRNHAELFFSEGHWVLRDLGSRNGTYVAGQRITQDVVLNPGDVVRIANCYLMMVKNLSEAFRETAALAAAEQAAAAEATRDPGLTSDSGLIPSPDDPTTITHRRNETRFLRPVRDPKELPRMGRNASTLCRLAFELAKQRDIEAVARVALDGLFEATAVDAGAVLLAPRDATPPIRDQDLHIVAFRTDRLPRYHRVSSFLANTVLREGEAVLARNITDDSMLASRDSKGEIHSTGVLCAPIRREGRVVGLLHAYSTQQERQPDPDDLEFALAVAENVALALENLSRQLELAEHLSLSKSELQQLRRQLGDESQLVGRSAAILRVQEEIRQAAASRATVLIRGESGVGKELVARAIHFAGPRKRGPFVCINCAALSETLLESELFGHERGAFTGATERKIGKFEAAHEGTILLDEIGEMSPQLQAKFLRVLEGHPFERVGGSKAIKVDVRVIAATNRDLEQAVAEGRFRKDLYFRLRVLEIVVPPLRQRPEDIPLLAAHFLKRFCAETGKRIRGFTPEAEARMLQYQWPGNVRELKNVVERAVVLARGEWIDADDLALSRLAPSPAGAASPVVGTSAAGSMSLEEMERIHVAATLQATGWNKSKAARILGIERSTLDRKIRRYRLQPPPSRAK